MANDPQDSIGALGDSLDPGFVSWRARTRDGPKDTPYIEAFRVIDQANRIFGYSGWGQRLEFVHLIEIDIVARGGEIKTAKGYQASVLVEVNGFPPRSDLGFHPVENETLEGHDTAMKGAVSDAMKRAFRTFGPQFGNDLYAKGAREQSPSQGRQRPAQGPARQSPIEQFWEAVKNVGGTRENVADLVGGDPSQAAIQAYMTAHGIARLADVVVLINAQVKGMEQNGN